MLDVVRLTVLVWSALCCARARIWTFVLPSALALYVLFLDAFSGFTIRDEGVQPPVMALLLLFLGPSGLPRGPLPPLPLASRVVRHPQMVDAACALLLFLTAQVLRRRTERVPEFASRLPALDRAELALTFAAVMTALATLVTALPQFLGGGFD